MSNAKKPETTHKPSYSNMVEMSSESFDGSLTSMKPISLQYILSL